MHPFTNTMAKNPKNRPLQTIAGFPVGVLVIPYSMHLLKGNVANAQTFDFPVLYEVLEGVDSSDLMSGNPEVGGRVIAGGQKLIARGARIILGACGSFAHYQELAAKELPVPAFLTVMMQVPWILSSLMPHQKVGVIMAAASALTPEALRQSGITDAGRLVVDEGIGLESFLKMSDLKSDFDPGQLCVEMAHLARNMVKENPEIAAFVLQCSDMPPFAFAIQDAVNLPVFDMTSLIEWAAKSAMRRPYL